MNLTGPQIKQRPSFSYIYHQKRGVIQEIAPITWSEMYGLYQGSLPLSAGTELIGASWMDGKDMIYEAGLALPSPPSHIPRGLSLRTQEGGKYASYLYKGAYDGIGKAFEKMFRELNEHGLELRPSACLENYLNDPSKTPEAELLTELLIPIE